MSGESLPAYGVFRVDAFVSPYYEAKKPDGSVAMHFINGPVAVANNAFGEAPLWHYPAEVLTDDALFGKVIGPERDTWKMNQCSDGWIAINSPASGRVMVACMFSDRRVQCVATSLIGTAANSLTSPSTGTADLLAKKSDGNLYVVGSVTITNRFRTASIDNGNISRPNGSETNFNPMRQIADMYMSRCCCDRTPPFTRNIWRSYKPTFIADYESLATHSWSNFNTDLLPKADQPDWITRHFRNHASGAVGEL